MKNAGVCVFVALSVNREEVFQAEDIHNKLYDIINEGRSMDYRRVVRK